MVVSWWIVAVLRSECFIVGKHHHYQGDILDSVVEQARNEIYGKYEHGPHHAVIFE